MYAVGLIGLYDFAARIDWSCPSRHIVLRVKLTRYAYTGHIVRVFAGNLCIPSVQAPHVLHQIIVPAVNPRRPVVRPKPVPCGNLEPHEHNLTLWVSGQHIANERSNLRLITVLRFARAVPAQQNVDVINGRDSHSLGVLCKVHLSRILVPERIARRLFCRRKLDIPRMRSAGYPEQRAVGWQRRRSTRPDDLDPRALNRLQLPLRAVGVCIDAVLVFCFCLVVPLRIQST